MMGRRLPVPRAYKGVCRFTFGDLCRADVFAADYHAVGARFHTVVLEGVPVLSTEVRRDRRRRGTSGDGCGLFWVGIVVSFGSARGWLARCATHSLLIVRSLGVRFCWGWTRQKHNEARRFITLVDVLYETRTRYALG